MRNSLSFFRLQSIDSQTAIVNNRVNSINTFFVHSGILTKAENQAALISHKRIASQDAQENIEGQIQRLRIKIEQTESSLYNGKINNPKDLRDLEKELGLLNHNLEQLEDSLLDAMENVEVNTIKENKALSILSMVNEKWSAKHDELEQEKQELLGVLHTLSLERDAIVHSVPENSLAIYERLLIIKQGIAVCCIRDNTCLSCGSSLTLAFTQTARLSEELNFCPSCGRIMFCE